MGILGILSVAKWNCSMLIRRLWAKVGNIFYDITWAMYYVVCSQNEWNRINALFFITFPGNNEACMMLSILE